jgi:hypothetical protein
MIRRWAFPMFPIMVLFFGVSSQAQDKPTAELRATVGQRSAILESACSNGGQIMGGGAARYYFTPRVSAGPEVLFMRACDRQVFTFYHPRLTATIDLAMDLRQSGRIRPYLVAGIGVVRHESRASTLSKIEFNGGAGARFFVNDRLFIAPEFRAGGEVAFMRFSVSVGWLFQ